ncbi:MAG: hypothetical protein JWM10_2213 [Myxococcaceae bacterium]|nr:hypothetical protein [Myxococcaceae bacterium]
MRVAFTRPCIFSVAALGLLGGCSSSSGNLPPEVLDAGSDARVDAGPADRPPPAPTLLAVQPGHGSFLGGTEVTLRGSNFADGAVVRFGGSLVQPRYTTFVDRNRITVRTPAGRAGEVDVEVEVEGRVATLPRGFRYDSFYVDPPLGPTTGGARVSLHGLGTQFRDGMRVTFDGAPCTAVAVTSPELASCLTPEHPDGRVEVAIEGVDEPVSIPDGYTYADSADSVGGGLSGGTVVGSITVTVLDAMSGDPVPSAFVFLNNAPGAVPPSAGQTGARGQVTLSPPTLTPPVTVTASERCHTTTTIQSFDARNATIYLQPLMIPGCGSPGMPMGMPQRAVYPATITGELVWAGPNEFAPNPWSNIPEPREGFRRVAYVWVSRPDIFTVDPVGAALAQQRDTVLELVAGTGGRGYPFTLQARPAAVAVYALAGLENVVPAGSSTPVRFTPWVMGLARSVLGAPRATIDNVVIDMNIPLDHETPLEVAPLGGTDPDAPDQFHASGFIDLGGEGVIPMPHATVTGLDGGSYRLSGLPAFSRNLADARLTVHARLASGDITGPRAFQDTPSPCTALVVSGITSPDETVRVGGWLGIPRMTAPEQGARLPDDRTVHFAIEGAAPDLLLFTMQWNATSWQHIAPGAERAFQYPDLSSLMGLSDLPAGSFLSLSLVGLRLTGFEFNRFTYTTIGPQYWTAYAGRGEYLTR